MSEQSQKREESNSWMLRYIVTAETAVLITAATFFLTQYTSFVKASELQVLAPYVKDRDAVIKHIGKSEDVLIQLGESIHHLNMQMLKTNALLEIRITKLESELKRQ